jgi:hypothetical protein
MRRPAMAGGRSPIVIGRRKNCRSRPRYGKGARNLRAPPTCRVPPKGDAPPYGYAYSNAFTMEFKVALGRIARDAFSGSEW